MDKKRGQGLTQGGYRKGGVMEISRLKKEAGHDPVWIGRILPPQMGVGGAIEGRLRIRKGENSRSQEQKGEGLSF